MRQFKTKDLAKKTVLTLLVILWLVFPFGQFLRFRFFAGADANFFDLIGGAVALLILIRFLSSKRRRSLGVFMPWFLLAAIWLASLRLSPLGLSYNEGFVSFLYLVRWLAGSSFIFLGLVLSGQNRISITRVMLIGGLCLAISGMAQYVVFPYLGLLIDRGWDPHLYRVVGSFLDPGFIGFIFVCSLILLVQARKAVGLSKRQWAVVMGILFVSLLLTYSRASYLAFLFGSGVLAVRKRVYRWYIKVLVVFVLSVLLLPRPAGEGIRLERENSIRARIESWSHALVIFGKHPFLGVGFNAYRYAQERQGYLRRGDENHAGAGSDSSLLLVLATSGVMGAGVFGWFVYRVVAKVSSDNGVFGNVGIATLAALFIHSWFLNSLFYPWVLVWVGTIVGLAMAQSQVKEKS